MTAAPAPPLTCTAVFPLPGPNRPRCDRIVHDDRLHTACVEGVPFAWSDPDSDDLSGWEKATVAAVRSVYGDDLAATDAARLEAIGSAMVTLQNHRWLGVDDTDVDVQRCSCGWAGTDHERHTAAQLYATGALDRHAPPVAAAMQAAQKYAARMRRTEQWQRRLTGDARRLVEAVTAAEAIGEGP